MPRKEILQQYIGGALALAGAAGIEAHHLGGLEHLPFNIPVDLACGALVVLGLMTFATGKRGGEWLIPNPTTQRTYDSGLPF